MNLNRNRTSAYPSSQDFYDAFDDGLMRKYAKELENRMERTEMSANDLEQEILFMQRERQAQRTPFATHEEFVEFANKLHAFTSCLTTKRATLSWSGE